MTAAVTHTQNYYDALAKKGAAYDVHLNGVYVDGELVPWAVAIPAWRIPRGTADQKG